MAGRGRLDRRQFLGWTASRGVGPALVGGAVPTLLAAWQRRRRASGQPAVFSSEPGRDDYTPAWTLHRVRFSGDRRLLASVADIEAAQRAGAVSVERTGVVVNYGW